MNVLHVRIARLALALVALAAPAFAAEHDDQPQERPTVLDLSVLDHVDVEPFTGSLLHEHEDLLIGDGDDTFRLTRTWASWGGSALDFGFHWASPLSLRVELEPDGSRAVLIDERGFPHRFKREGGQLRQVEGLPLVLERNKRGHLRLVGRVPGEELRFDGEGRIRSKRHYGREVLRYGYREGVLVALLGSWGRLDLVRDGEGRLVEVRGPGRLRLSYSRDERGDLIEVAQGARYVSYGYDERGRLAKLANGQARIEHDELGRVVAINGPGVRPLRLSYAHGNDETHSELVRGDQRFRYQRSADGRRCERRHPSGAVEVLTLDERRRPLRRQLGQRTWSWSYDAQGRLSERRTPEGVTRFSYQGQASQPAGMELPGGIKLALAYDRAGRLSEARHPGLGTFKLRYDQAGRVSEQVDARGTTQRFRYDERGYLVAVSDPRGTTRLTRSAEGELSEVLHADGRKTVFASQRQGRRVTVRQGEHVIEDVSYDRRGRPSRRRGAQGETINYRWSLRGELLSARDELGPIARFSYDDAGRVASISDGAGNAVRYERPDAKTLVIDDATAGKSVLRHDAYGLLVEEVRAGSTIRYRYDSADRLVARETPQGTESFVYGAQGRLVRLEGPSGGYRLGYDPAGRLTSLTHLGLGKSVRYRYDVAGDRVETRLPWGTIRYERDELGRVQKLTTAQGQTIRFEHRPDGRRSAIHYPNGVQTQFRYEGARLAEVRSSKGQQVLSQRAYRYDARGRVAEVSDEEGRKVRYERDARGRLLAARGAGLDERYAYDQSDNLLRAGAKALAGNRLPGAGERRYAYDAAGNLSSVTGPKGTTRYAYDVDGHLTRAQLPGGQTVRYGYAPNGTRLWREDGEGKTEFLNDLAHVAGELRGGQVVRSYVHGEEVDDVLALETGGQSYYYHYDAVRSVTALSDGEGQVAASYRYSPFGETLAAEGRLAKQNPYRYTSRSYEQATGLYHFRARSYDPTQGRFTTPDPYGRRGGLNLYAYALNDPTRFNDPWGLWPKWLDRAAERVADVVSEAATSAVAWAEQNPIANGLLEGGRVAVAFGKGFGTGVYSGLKGIATMVLHPVQTAKDIHWALNNMDQVKAALGDKFEEYQQAWEDGDYAKVAEMTGYVLGEVTAGFVGAKGVDKIAKLGSVRRVAHAAAASRPAQAVGRGVSAVTAPIRSAAAPVLRPVAVVAAPVVRALTTATKPFDWAAEKILDTAIWPVERLTRPARQALARRGRVPPVTSGANQLGNPAARLGQGAQLGGGGRTPVTRVPPRQGGASQSGGAGARAANGGGQVNGSGQYKGAADRLRNPEALGDTPTGAPTKPHGDLYRGAREAWSEPVDPAAASRLSQRAQAAQQSARQLRERMRTASPEQRAIYQQRYQQLTQERMGKSGTIRGNHGASNGTDGASIGARNFNAAERQISQWIREGQPLTVERIQELNRILGKDLANNGFEPGVLRSGNLDVSAGGNIAKTYVPAKQVGQAMDDFVKWYQANEATMPPIELAARSYQRLVSIHPFPDANGRTTRMVMDWVLRKNGLPPATMDNVNVAVFGGRNAFGIETKVGATPTEAIEAVTQGVEKSLEVLGAPIP
ncbi:MAG TPA: hypothetical protein DEA08_30110 [Planctomycetes bacterium]|nr:hypothetical protein [Planctomycetota bacterium]